MWVFREFFSNLRQISRFNSSKKSSYIYYKIVDINSEKNHFVLQCKNTRVILKLSLDDIVNDKVVLHALHPTQACYIGLQYAGHLKQNNCNSTLKNNLEKQFPSCRYGRYTLQHQNRKGLLYFVDKNTEQGHLMDPRDIALSNELIQEFDAAQSFYIGLFAGLRAENSIKKDSSRPILRLVK